MGDSRCFVGSVNGQGAVESCALSTDHNPDVVSEAQRIMAHKVSQTGLSQAWHRSEPASGAVAARTPGREQPACNQSAAEHACGNTSAQLGTLCAGIAWDQNLKLRCCMPVLEKGVLPCSATAVPQLCLCWQWPRCPAD